MTKSMNQSRQLSLPILVEVGSRDKTRSSGSSMRAATVQEQATTESTSDSLQASHQDETIYRAISDKYFHGR